jgi:hypothetical protein
MVLVQLHAHAASPTPPEIRAAMRDSFRDLVAVVAGAFDGATPEAINAFFAQGMLMNVTAALGLEDVAEPWADVLTGRAIGPDAVRACAMPPDGPEAAGPPAPP